MIEIPQLPDIIGLYSPYPRMGKSTVANFLINQFGYTRLKFSTPVKAPLYALGLIEDEVEGHLKDSPNDLLDGMTPREKMHLTAQELFRENGNDFVSKIANLSLQDYISQGKRIVIDDVRFKENYDLVRSYPSAQIWRLYSDKALKIEAYDTTKLEGLNFDLRLLHTDNPQLLFDNVQQHLRNVTLITCHL